jgi:hypothetical protein
MRQAFLAMIALSVAITCVAQANENPTADELLALEGDAFLQRLAAIQYSSEFKFSADELVALSEKLFAATTQLPKDDDYRHLFDRFFEKACEKAKERQLPKLVGMYVRLDAAAFNKQSLLPPLATALILEHLRTRADWPRVEMPPIESDMPAELRDASPDLIEAWQLYKRAVQPFERVFRRADRGSKGISFQTNERSFSRLIDDVLTKRGEHLAEQLAEFEWSGWCGTGSDSLREPQSLGTFIALLNDDRIAEAVGAAIYVEGDRLLISADQRHNARVEFLKRCGLDWEMIFAGTQLVSELERSRGGGPNSCLSELAAFGSDRAARLIMEMARRSERNYRATYAQALVTFIPGDTENISGGGRFTNNLVRHPDMRISAETMAQVLSALRDFAKPDAPSDVVEAALVGFARAKSPETKPTLRPLLKHPSPEVTETAAQILRSLGETVAPSRVEPVRFQISINGAPAPAKTEVHYQIEFGNHGSVSSSRRTDADGTIELERKYFVDAERQATSVAFSGERGKHPTEEPYYLVALPVPANLDEITPVDVRLSAIELRIERSEAPAPDASPTAVVHIKRHEPERDPSMPYAYFDRMERQSEVPLGAPIVLNIQSGSYDLEVFAAGAEKFASTFTVDEQSSPVSVRLKPGGDVHFEIVRPDGESGTPFTIISGNQKLATRYYDYGTKTYRGLPAGDYVLHIPSSAENLAESRGGREFTPLHGYAGREVAFTVAGNTSAVLDLGELRLDPASQ